MRASQLPNRLKPLLLIALGLFLYGRLANGTLFFYINQRFAIYTFLAIFGLLLVGLSYHFSQTTDAHDHHPDGHPHAHGHTHAPGHQHTLSWGSVLLLVLPIGLGLLVPPQPLGASALSNREINAGANTVNSPAASRDAAEKAAADKNILDWWETFHAAANPNENSAIVGQRTRVVGFVYQDKQYGNTHFLVTRFVVSCCVADAAALGLVVAWPAAQQLHNDQWVEVTGTFAAGHLATWSLPILVAQQVTPVAVPNQPYLYP